MSALSTPIPPAPQREIICADAIAWMQARGRIDGACAVTSLPDVSEIGKSLPVWREWQAKTSFFPYGRGLKSADGFALVTGTIVWLAATWAHEALGGRPAGVWAFFA